MNLHYKSTRNSDRKVTASEAILKGLAPDGGLFVPEEIPKLDISLDELKDMTYQPVSYTHLATKKAAAKTTAAKKTTAKKEIKVNAFVEYYGKQVEEKDIIASVKKAWTSTGKKVGDIKSMDLYIKPEEGAVYYVKMCIRDSVVIKSSGKGGIGMAEHKIVTIGRQFGSGGHEIGNRLATRLDIPLYDNNLVRTVAEKLDLREETAQAVDETTLNSFLAGYVIAPMEYSTYINATEYIQPRSEQVYELQCEIIRKLAESCLLYTSRCVEETDSADWREQGPWGGERKT